MTAAYVRNVGRNCSMSKNPVVIGAENHCEKKTRMWNTVGTAPGGNVTSIRAEVCIFTDLPHPMQFTGSNSRTRESMRRFLRKKWRKDSAKDLRRWQAEALIPIPLSEKRQKKRGYNQAKILARELSKRTGIPVEEGALFRIRDTRPQKELDDRERQQNLRQAFAVAKCWKPVRSVVLVDDIYTTGSTINKAAKMLKKAGVSKVYFLTISIGQGL